jgi:hypothetical protein
MTEFENFLRSRSVFPGLRVLIYLDIPFSRIQLGVRGLHTTMSLSFVHTLCCDACLEQLLSTAKRTVKPSFVPMSSLFIRQSTFVG